MITHKERRGCSWLRLLLLLLCNSHNSFVAHLQMKEATDAVDRRLRHGELVLDGRHAVVEHAQSLVKPEPCERRRVINLPRTRLRNPVDDAGNVAERVE